MTGLGKKIYFSLKIKNTMKKFFLLCFALVKLSFCQNYFQSLSPLDQKNLHIMASSNVLLLTGTRWQVNGSFQCFGKEVLIEQHPGEKIGSDEEHEVKTGLTIWDAVYTNFLER